jgi:TonB dependent receptor
VPVDPASAPYLNLYPLPNGRDFGNGSAEFLSTPDTITNEDYALARVDHQLNEKTSIFGRYTYDQDSVDAPGSISPFGELTASRRQYTTLQANSMLGPKGFNNFRFAFNRSHSIDDPLSLAAGPLSIIPGEPLGAIQLGSTNPGGAASRALTPLGQANGNFLFAYNIFEWGDDLTYVIGKHTLKTGVDIQRMQDNQMQNSTLNGSYTFSSFITFLAGTPSNLQASAPLGIPQYFGLRQSMYAVYGQDEYNVNSRLTLNLGLRWEIATDPYDTNGKTALLPSLSASDMVISDRYFNIGKKNFEPRVGLAWKVNDSGKTVLRAAAGIYHDQILPWAYNIQASVPPFFGRFSAGNPPFPNGYQIIPTGSQISTACGCYALKAFDPFEKTPTTYQYNVSLQQEIFKNTVVEVYYAGNHANHLLTAREADSPIPVNCTTSPNSCPAGMLPGQPPLYYPAGEPRRNPAWAGIGYSEMTGNSEYNSLTFTLRRQFSGGLIGQIYYTYSKSLDDSSNASGGESARSPSTLLDAENPSVDWGLSEFDLKHSVVGNISYAVPFRARSKDLGAVVNGWTVDGIATFHSGLPFTARLASPVSRDGNIQQSERPNLNPGFSNNPNHGVSAGCPGFLAGTPVGNADNWYDPCSFSLPEAGTYGNLGRNTIIGPGTQDVDIALERVFNVGERVKATFRAEAFNILNHANFGLPNTLPLGANGVASPSAGVITYTTTSSRQLQFAIRINF